VVEQERGGAANKGVIRVGAAGLAPVRELELLERLAHNSSTAAPRRSLATRARPRTLRLYVTRFGEVVSKQRAAHAEIADAGGSASGAVTAH
jgi:hypothetical protein